MNADYDQGNRRDPQCGNCFHLADGARLYITGTETFPFQQRTVVSVKQIDRAGNWIDTKLDRHMVVGALDADLKSQLGVPVATALHNIATPDVTTGRQRIDQFAQRMLEESMITLGEAIDFKAPQS
jgi:hypothetical protein